MGNIFRDVFRKSGCLWIYLGEKSHVVHVKVLLSMLCITYLVSLLLESKKFANEKTASC